MGEGAGGGGKRTKIVHSKGVLFSVTSRKMSSRQNLKLAPTKSTSPVPVAARSKA